MVSFECILSQIWMVLTAHGFPGVNFINVFLSSFHARRSQKCKKTDNLTVFFFFRDLLAQKLLVERWWNWAQLGLQKNFNARFEIDLLPEIFSIEKKLYIQKTYKFEFKDKISSPHSATLAKEAFLEIYNHQLRKLDLLWKSSWGCKSSLLDSMSVRKKLGTLFYCFFIV